MNTRGNANIFLLGHDDSQIIGCKLPSKGQILKVLFYKMRKIKLDLHSCALFVVKGAQVLWDKARIPTRRIDHSVEQVQKLYQQWRTLYKTCKRRSALQEKREYDFLQEMDDLFDIAYADALNMIKIDEDKIFLINQRRKGRPGSMIGSDRVLFEKEQRKQIREEKERIRIEKHLQQVTPILATIQDNSDNEEQQTDVNMDELDVNTKQITSHNTETKRKRGRRHFITPKLVATLDNCKISDINAVRVLIAISEALGHDVSELVINKTSIRLCRKKVRSETATTLKSEFLKKNLQGIVVHWDGKLLPSLTGGEKVDRLPVIITSAETEQLLGIPALQVGTGKEQAEAIFQLLEEYHLTNKVEALCFDTTATNTGRLQGSCVRLEQMLEKDLLYLPCRHHVYEIVLRTVFEKKNLQISGPTLTIFQRFKGWWTKINQQNFKYGIVDKRVKSAIRNSEKEQLLEFAKKYIKKQQPRADYTELLELMLIFLGEHNSKYKFKLPGAFHHARWMAKAIYALKMFLFRDEFFMSSDEIEAIRDSCLFIVKIYIKPWIEAPIAAKAPMQDLNFIKNILDYHKINEAISKEVMHKYSNHLWYLAPETIALSFFDSSIADEVKISMVERLNLETDNDSKRLITDLKVLATKNIADLVSKKTLHFFERFSIPIDFLKLHPSQWDNNPDFKFGFIWKYGIQLWGTASASNIAILQRFQSKMLRLFVDAPWFIKNKNIHRNLQIPYVSDEIKRFSTKYLDRLSYHENVLAITLLDDSNEVRRLKRHHILDLPYRKN